MHCFVGIDAGTTYVKVALVDENLKLLGFDQKPTGIDPDGTTRKMINKLIGSCNIQPENIQRIIATGYNRRNVRTAHETVTEIKAHARGASWAAPDGVQIRTVIDIGGQDSKVIVLDDDNEIANLTMNDKCAAGTGRFLESLARVLELDISELGPLSLDSTMPLTINSTCVVFAESEVISLVARKNKLEDIAAGIHRFLARRIADMVHKADIKPEILLAGGGGRNAGIAKALEEDLLADIHVPSHPQHNGAVGAALIGMMERQSLES